VLEGSIRRGGDRVRIGAQLVDALTGIQRWAERYDRKLEDVFAIQDEVVCSIAPVLAAHINKAEVERAYQLARRAVQLEPTLPPAHAQLGIVLTFKGLHDEAVAEVERALALHSNFNDRRFASTLLYAGFPARAMETTNALIRLDPYYLR
jgi:tetratricopeptide (TPR) repeat protein